MQQNDGTAGAAFTLCGGCGGALVGLTAACVSIRSEAHAVWTALPECRVLREGLGYWFHNYQLSGYVLHRRPEM
jgi:predicted metal-binding protein